ncbi:MAG: hypothetical protein K0U52_00340 [Gammaproteobacteria bacterium]|nr:hypothetical protein [Gammaproteobacteria bacterium]
MFWKPKQLNHQRSPSLPKHNGYVGVFRYGSCHLYNRCMLPPNNPYVGMLRHAPHVPQPPATHPFIQSTPKDLTWDPMLTWGCRQLGEFLENQDSPKPRLSKHFFSVDA